MEEMTGMPDSMGAVRTFLDAQGTGPLADTGGLIARLARAWPDLAGSGGEAMEPRRLGRLVDPEWLPPVLTFVVERHGGTVRGSTRADRQRWTVDLDAGTAVPATIGYRQLRPRAARLDVDSIVADVVRLVAGGVDDERLRWSADRGTVRVAVGRLVPAGGPKQTVEGRRRRVGARLQVATAEAGWSKTAAATFTRSPADAKAPHGAIARDSDRRPRK